MKINVIPDKSEVTMTQSQYDSYHEDYKYEMSQPWMGVGRRPTFAEWLKTKLKMADNEFRKL